METYRETARDVPIFENADVVVAGGGPAGFSAAVASARNGAKTVLCERFGYLGGTATASLMACLNGFRNQVEPDGYQTVRGIAEELVLALKDMDGIGKSPYPQKQYATEPGSMEYSYAVDTEKLKYLMLKMCHDAGVILYLHTWTAAPLMDGSQVDGVIAETKSGRIALVGKVTIDATGDADIAARAGVPYWQIKADEQPRLNDAMMYRIGFGDQRPPNGYACDFGSTSVVWGPSADPIDGTDVRELSNAEVNARLQIYKDFENKQLANADLKTAVVLETPPLLGIRQTRFIKGEYTLTEADVLNGARFKDAIALSSCAVIHYYGYRRYLEHEGYEIPYRCLVPQNIDGLIAAGRCISSEQQPYESHRAMIPIMAIGQAAGTAASICAKDGVQPRALSAEKLRDTLIGDGAEVGQSRQK